MPKRKYTHIKEIETQLITMREAGMTRQEIADELGLEKEQITKIEKRGVSPFCFFEILI